RKAQKVITYGFFTEDVTHDLPESHIRVISLYVLRDAPWQLPYHRPGDSSDKQSGGPDHPQRRPPVVDPCNGPSTEKSNADANENTRRIDRKNRGALLRPEIIRKQ